MKNEKVKNDAKTKTTTASKDPASNTKVPISNASEKNVSVKKDNIPNTNKGISPNIKIISKEDSSPKPKKLASNNNLNTSITNEPKKKLTPDEKAYKILKKGGLINGYECIYNLTSVCRFVEEYM
jgi:hypothetical protein